MLLVKIAGVPGVPPLTGICTIVSLPVLATNRMLPPVFVEAEAFGAERGAPRRLEQRVLPPRRLQSGGTGRAGFPERAVEGTRHIDVAGGIDRQRFEPRAGRVRERDEVRSAAGLLVD